MDIGQIVLLGAPHAPYIVIIALLLRSSAKKDRIIETLTQKALEMVHQTRGAAQVATTAIRVAKDVMEEH